MTHAVHSCGILDDGKIIYGGEAAGYVLRFADGRALYFAGDTNVFSDMHLIEQLYHPELAFLPIGDLFTMGPREAALACKLLKAGRVIPMHFGTFPALTGGPTSCASWWRPAKPRSGSWSRASPWSGRQRLPGFGPAAIATNRRTPAKKPAATVLFMHYLGVHRCAVRPRNPSAIVK